MDCPYHWAAEYHYLQIRRRKRAGQQLYRLIGKKLDICQPKLCRERTQSSKLAPTSHEDETEARIRLQPERRLQKRIQWVHGAVIAGVHDDVFPCEAMPLPERRPALLVEVCVAVQGPRWYYVHSFRSHSL